MNNRKSRLHSPPCSCSNIPTTKSLPLMTDPPTLPVKSSTVWLRPMAEVRGLPYSTSAIFPADGSASLMPCGWRRSRPPVTGCCSPTPTCRFAATGCVARSFGEGLMLAGFAMLFIWGHRPWKVADPKAMDFMGLGPFNLIRRDAYEKLGTFRALRMEVIEDMKLGKLVKQHGFAQSNVFGSGLLPWHWGEGALGIARNLTKNFFALMQFRW